MDKQTIDKIIDTIATIKCPVGPTGMGMTVDIPIKRLTGDIERPEKKELDMSQKQLEQMISYRDYLHLGT